MSITNFAKLFMKSNLNSIPFKNQIFWEGNKDFFKKVGYFVAFSHYLNFTDKASKVFSWITSGVHKKYWNTNFWRFWLCCVVKTVRTHLWVGSFFQAVNDIWVRPLLSVDKLCLNIVFTAYLNTQQFCKIFFSFSLLVSLSFHYFSQIHEKISISFIPVKQTFFYIHEYFMAFFTGLSNQSLNSSVTYLHQSKVNFLVQSVIEMKIRSKFNHLDTPLINIMFFHKRP